MSDSTYKTPFKDAVCDKVPFKGTGSGKYGSETGEDMPGRDGSGVAPELNRDTHWNGPKDSGPIKSPFKDAVS